MVLNYLLLWNLWRDFSFWCFLFRFSEDKAALSQHVSAAAADSWELAVTVQISKFSFQNEPGGAQDSDYWPAAWGGNRWSAANQNLPPQLTGSPDIHLFISSAFCRLFISLNVCSRLNGGRLATEKIHLQEQKQRNKLLQAAWAPSTCAVDS